MPKNKVTVDVGQVTYYVPSVKENRNAAWKIPRRMRRLGTHLDGSNWYFNTALYPEVKKIADEYDGKRGIRFYIVESFTAKDPSVIEKIVRDSIQKTISSVVPSIQASLESLKAQWDAVDPVEVDGKIVDVIRENQRKLEDAMVVVASFGLTEDFAEVQQAIAMALTSELEKARLEHGKAILAKHHADLIKEDK